MTEAEGWADKKTIDIPAIDRLTNKVKMVTVILK